MRCRNGFQPVYNISGSCSESKPGEEDYSIYKLYKYSSPFIIIRRHWSDFFQFGVHVSAGVPSISSASAEEGNHTDESEYHKNGSASDGDERSGGGIIRAGSNKIARNALLAICDSGVSHGSISLPAGETFKDPCVLPWYHNILEGVYVLRHRTVLSGTTGQYQRLSIVFNTHGVSVSIVLEQFPDDCGIVRRIFAVENAHRGQCGGHGGIMSTK